MKASIYETITNQIVAAIEEGAGLYQMPWHRQRHDITSPINLVSGNSYRGLNVMTLWMTAEAKAYSSGTWATYQQWQERGAQVRKGEKAAPVFFWKKLERGEEDGDQESNGRFVARGYAVFNAAQVDGYKASAMPQLSDTQRIESAERFFTAVPATIEHSGNACCFRPVGDTVAMVPFADFKNPLGYYTTLGHELTHWSGGKERLDRDLSGRFGTEAYAMEELVAELGAAFIAGRLGLPSEPRRDHAPYIASWLKALKNDSRAIFTAATKAQQAVDYLASFSLPEPDE